MNKSEILSIVVIVVGLVVIGITFLYIGQFERMIADYEVFDTSGSGYSPPTNVTFIMERGHDYRVYVSLSDYGHDPLVSSTVR